MSHQNNTLLQAIDNANSVKDDLEGLASLAMALGASRFHEPQAVSFIARSLDRCASQLDEFENLALESAASPEQAAAQKARSHARAKFNYAVDPL
ncbi:MAG: hypothetical protein Q4C41_00760 [Eggerthellaceae bacterium]|nr:hypothetical protein [Eggerthellaceae bacterium]